MTYHTTPFAHTIISLPVLPASYIHTCRSYRYSTTLQDTHYQYHWMASLLHAATQATLTQTDRSWPRQRARCVSTRSQSPACLAPRGPACPTQWPSSPWRRVPLAVCHFAPWWTALQGCPLQCWMQTSSPLNLDGWNLATARRW